MTDIRGKLARAAAAPELLGSFGASAHRYRLNPPLTEREVSAFEAEHGIRLPASYRTFLLEIGDGGAGPSYGLLSLADAYHEVSDGFPGFLKAPSPFVPGRWYDDDWWDAFCGPDGEPDPVQGTLAVVHHGCTSYTHLVVSGAGRGRLVNVDLNGFPAPYVLEDADFLTWYERWLEELLAGCDVAGFGEKLPGGEDTLLDILTGDPSPPRRAQAARSVTHLAEISPAAVRAFATAAADPDPGVRHTVLRLAWRYTLPLSSEARTALADPEPGIRAEALRLLTRLDPPGLADLARPHLADAAPQVAGEAMSALATAGELAVADVAPLLADPGKRSAAAYHLLKANGEASALLEPLLEDEDPDVRRQAVQTAERRDEHTLLPALRRREAVEDDETVLVNLRRVISAWC